MRYMMIALILLMVGCGTMPGYDRVDKKQKDHELDFTTKRVDVWVASDFIVGRACGEDAIACTIDINKHYTQIFVRKGFEWRKFALEHEFNHITYGPLHR